MKSLFILLTFGLLLTSCGSSTPEANTATPDKTAAKPSTLDLDTLALRNIRVGNAALIPDSDAFSAVGEISFDEDNVVRVYPIVSGSVESVNASLGDYVGKGKELAMLYSTDISVYQRDYNIAKTDLGIAERNLKRSRELFETNSIPERELIEAQRIFENAQHEFNEKKQILELYGGSTEKNDAVFRVTAPHAGYIVERNVNQGTQIRTDNNTPMFVISDLKTVWVWANIYESDLAKVKEGDQVQVTTIAYPDRVFTGKITKVGVVLDPASRVMKVRIELPNPEGLLKPDMFATVSIAPSKSNQILAVPTSAIVIENNRYWVMRELAAGRFQKTEVTLGKIIQSNTQILSGLQPGEKVVVDGSLFLQTAYNKL